MPSSSGEKGPVTQRLPYHTEELKRNLRNFTALIELVICCFIKSKEPVSTLTWKLLQPPPLLLAQINNLCTNCRELCGLKEQGFILSQFWGLGGLKSSRWQSQALSEGSKNQSVACLSPRGWWSPATLVFSGL